MTSATTTQTDHFITFRLGDELFAIDVRQVREVLDMTPVTRMPTAPDYMRGVVNVRGTAIPVVELRRKFGLPAIADSVHTRIVVLEVEIDGEATVVGGLADSVHDVIAFDDTELGEAPRIGARWRNDLIKGIGKKRDEFVIVLDIHRVFASDEPALLKSAAAAVAKSEAQDLAS